MTKEELKTYIRDLHLEKEVEEIIFNEIEKATEVNQVLLDTIADILDIHADADEQIADMLNNEADVYEKAAEDLQALDEQEEAEVMEATIDNQKSLLSDLQQKMKELTQNNVSSQTTSSSTPQPASAEPV